MINYRKMNIDQFKLEFLKMIDVLDNKWEDFFNEIMANERFDNLMKNLHWEYINYEIFPRLDKVLEIFKLCSPDEIKVVILGQDPYHTPYMANGIAFAVDEDYKIPGSLKNIFKELTNCFLVEEKIKYLDLKKWVCQGVFLLNTVLTVQSHKPSSHRHLGWDFLIYELMVFFKTNYKDIIYIGFGTHAQNVIKQHKINPSFYFFTTHPSPFSCVKKNNSKSNIPSFLGSNIFNLINEKLIELKKQKIDFLKK